MLVTNKEKDQDQVLVESILPPLYSENPKKAIGLSSYLNELSIFRSRIKKISEVHEYLSIDLIHTALDMVDSSKVDDLNLPTHFRFQFICSEDVSKHDFAYSRLTKLYKKGDFDEMLQLSRKNFINEVNSYIKQQMPIELEIAKEFYPNLYPTIRLLNCDKLFKSSNGFIVIDPIEIKEAFYRSNSETRLNEKKSTEQIESNNIVKLVERFLIERIISKLHLFESQGIIKSDKFKIINKHLNKFSFQLIDTIKCDLNKVFILKVRYHSPSYVLKSYEDIVSSILNDSEINHKLLLVLPGILKPLSQSNTSEGKNRVACALVEIEDLNKVGNNKIIFSSDCCEIINLIYDD